MSQKYTVVNAGRIGDTVVELSGRLEEVFSVVSLVFPEDSFVMEVEASVTAAVVPAGFFRLTHPVIIESVMAHITMKRAMICPVFFLRSPYIG